MDGRQTLAGRRGFKGTLDHDETRLMRKGNGSELPLPLWERVGVRGYGLAIGRDPSPGSHLTMRSDLSHKGPVAQLVLVTSEGSGSGGFAGLDAGTGRLWVLGGRLRRQ